MAAPRALPGCLVGSWRGVPFAVPDVTTSAGRRLVSIELPGTDWTIHEDLGLATGPIRISGLYVGDDHIAAAGAFQAACEMPGPGTLVHPWLGAMTVVLKDPAEIRFNSGALLSWTFTAVFERWSGDAGVVVGFGTLGLIDAAVEVLGSAIDALISVGLDIVGGAIGEVLTATFVAIDATLELAAAAGDLATLIDETLIDGLGIADAIAVVEDAADTAVWIRAITSAIAGAGVPDPSPAIGVGPLGRSIEAAIEPWSAVAALLDLASAEASAASSARGEGVSLVRLATAAAAIAAIAEPLAAVDWESRQQALTARAQISEAIHGVAAAAIAAVDGATAAAAERRAVWSALAALRRTVHQDLDDRIGRLPAVMQVSPPTRVSAWLVAQHLFGDDPKAVLSGFEDIVTRNALAHPSICDVDPIEVLPQ